MTKRLKGKNLKLFLKSCNAVDEMNGIIAIKNFGDGVKVGAKLMLNLISEQ